MTFQVFFGLIVFCMYSCTICNSELDDLDLEVTQVARLKSKAKTALAARDDIRKEKVEAEKKASESNLAKLELADEL